MSGTDIYENRSLKCSCGNVINFDLNEYVLVECGGCKKNNAFSRIKGTPQSCLSCGKMLEVKTPEEMLGEEDLSVFHQIEEILGKGITTKVKVDRAGSMFSELKDKEKLAGYANHVQNYVEFNMYDSEYNSAVKAMNDASKKLQKARELRDKDELGKLEIEFSETAKRFTMLGGFKKSNQHKSVCENKSSECHFEKEKLMSGSPAPKKEKSVADRSLGVSAPSSSKPRSSTYSAVPPPPPVQYSGQKKNNSKAIFIGVAVALLFGIIALIFVFAQKPETAPSSSSGTTQTSAYDSDESEPDEVSGADESNGDGSDLDEDYQTFSVKVNDGDYDLLALNLYIERLKGYKDSDSIFESHKQNFYERFANNAKHYQDSTGFDLEITLETLEALSYFKGYQDADAYLDSTIEKNLSFADDLKSNGDQLDAADILLSVADYIEYYSDPEKLKSSIRDTADALSTVYPEKSEELSNYLNS